MGKREIILVIVHVLVMAEVVYAFGNEHVAGMEGLVGLVGSSVGLKERRDGTRQMSSIV